jgi:hypothetical protein
VDDLRIASHKVDEVEKMIKERDEKDYSQYYKHITSWSVVMSAIMILIIFVVAVVVVKDIEFYGSNYGTSGHPKHAGKKPPRDYVLILQMFKEDNLQ